MFPLSETADFLVCFPPSVSVQGPVAGILENLFEDPIKLWFLRLCSQGLWQLLPKVGMTIENNILKVLVEGICLPDSPNWRYRRNYDINKWQVWIREEFLWYRHHLRSCMDGIVGKTYQTYNSLSPLDRFKYCRSTALYWGRTQWSRCARPKSTH